MAEASIVVAGIALVGTIAQSIIGNRKQVSDLIGSVSNLVANVKSLTDKVDELVKQGYALDKRTDLIAKEQETMWHRIDEHTEAINDLRKE